MSITEREESLFAQIVDRAGENVKSILKSRSVEITDIAQSEDNDGKIRLSVGIVLDFSGKVPAGGVKVSFMRKVSDEASFRLPDPDQKEMPL